MDPDRSLFGVDGRRSPCFGGDTRFTDDPTNGPEADRVGVTGLNDWLP